MMIRLLKPMADCSALMHSSPDIYPQAWPLFAQEAKKQVLSTNKKCFSTRHGIIRFRRPS